MAGLLLFGEGSGAQARKYRVWCLDADKEMTVVYGTVLALAA